MADNQTTNGSESIKWIWLSVYDAIIIGIIELVLMIGNAITLVAIARYRSLRCQKNMLIGSLSVADLLVGICIQVTIAIDSISTAEGRYNRAAYLTGVFLIVSFCNVLCIALDRFIAIVKPLHYPSIVTKRTVCLMIIIAWVVPIVSLVSLYEYTIAHGSLVDMTNIQAKVSVKVSVTNVQAKVSVICTVIFNTVTLPIYCKIIIETRAQVRKIRSVLGNVHNAIQTHNDETSHTITHKGTRMVLILAITEKLLTLPNVVVQCVRLAGLPLNPAMSIVEIFATECILANSAVNIIIYAVFASDFRKTYKDMLCRCKRQNIQGSDQKMRVLGQNIPR